MATDATPRRRAAVLVEADLVELSASGSGTIDARTMPVVAADLEGVDDGSALVADAWIGLDFPGPGRWDRACELAVHAVLAGADRGGCAGVVFADGLPVDQLCELAAAVVSSRPGPATAVLRPASSLLRSGGDGVAGWYDTPAGPRLVRSRDRGWLALVACARQVTELEEHDACACPGDALIAEVASGREPAVLALERALRAHHVHVLAARLGQHAGAAADAGDVRAGL